MSNYNKVVLFYYYYFKVFGSAQRGKAIAGCGKKQAKEEANTFPSYVVFFRVAMLPIS